MAEDFLNDDAVLDGVTIELLAMRGIEVNSEIDRRLGMHRWIVEEDGRIGKTSYTIGLMIDLAGEFSIRLEGQDYDRYPHGWKSIWYDESYVLVNYGEEPADILYLWLEKIQRQKEPENPSSGVGQISQGLGGATEYQLATSEEALATTSLISQRDIGALPVGDAELFAALLRWTDESGDFWSRSNPSGAGALRRGGTRCDRREDRHRGRRLPDFSRWCQPGRPR